MTNHTTAAYGTPVGLRAIRAPVRDRLERVMEELGRIAVADFSMVNEVNDYLMKVPGKLFRPTLVLLASDIERKSPPSALTLAAVVELVHIATLVHDDAVDHSVLRRGMPTVNSVWSHQIAIIMGDYLYSRAVTELARLGDLEAVRVLASAANRMSVGEMRQLLAYDDVTYSEAEYFRLIDAKTASLMSAACELGALAGSPAHRLPLRRYGHALGMAFQITDDMLDYEGTESVTGKPAGLDLRGRKVTLPLVGALREMSPAEADQIRHLFTLVEPGDDEVESAIELVTRNGGLQYARHKAMEYANSAEAAIRALTPGPALDALRDAVLHVMNRSR
ncbi:MAG: polyprenyl synthetase family protein [Gemmatimonadetes bacterium]|nr:polyprenyl synthetase family protein [Gemmatimonadota bacterium]MDE2677061.1 polyprenyl synthetase family protein [Gemmatimonadota bacterium]MXX33133.1 polyprenyl synthetase family protein [Gemmatimonadota bacterium]MYD14275.1 polyprenyl synthetase family protein [Gemmatimonadota bacterium]MYI64510.1 polyprenyl synthetase family protein [Gemmatimonadota bacterium]